MAFRSKSRQVSILLVSSGLLAFLLFILMIRTFAMTFKKDAVMLCKESDADFIKAGDHIVGRFQQALRFKTISYEGGNYSVGELEKYIDFIQKEFPTIHSSPFVKLEVISKYSLLYTVKGRNPNLTPYMLVSHLDVVPVDPDKWEVPPFSGQIKDGYIYGRGTVDLKNSVMGILEAFEFLLNRGFEPKRTFYVTFGHDEEIGGLEGAKEMGKILESRKVELEYILDEGLTIVDGVLDGLQGPGALVGTAEKGYVDLKLTVEGVTGHSSMPPKQTSIGILARAISRLEANPHTNMFGKGPEQEMLQQLAPYYSFPYQVVLSNLWLFGPLVSWKLSQKPSSNAFLRTTTAATLFNGGLKSNILPMKATAYVNHRVHPAQTIEEVVDHDRRVIDDDRVKIEVTRVTKPSVISPSNDDSYGFQVIKMSIRQIWHDMPVAPGLLIAGTDSKHYLHLTKCVYRFCPTYNRPIDLPRFHGNNERLSIKNYEQTINFYKHVILNSDNETLKTFGRKSDEL